MVDMPTPWPVATPPERIVATVVLLELQVTSEVIATVLPSEYVPVAFSCWVLPLKTEGFAGVTPIDTKVAVATVTPVLAVWPSKMAVIGELPADTPVTRPVLAPTVATAGVADA
jgi:hypothetical protein